MLKCDDFSDVPAKVNEVYKARNSTTIKKGANSEGGGGGAGPGVCSKCGGKLSGEAVEVAGMRFHIACFGCTDCGAKLFNSCINIDGKPYCDGTHVTLQE
jgi:hypothetical protein